MYPIIAALSVGGLKIVRVPMLVSAKTVVVNGAISIPMTDVMALPASAWSKMGSVVV